MFKIDAVLIIGGKSIFFAGVVADFILTKKGVEHCSDVISSNINTVNK